MKRDLVRLANHRYDVLIVGGGIHGVVAAWDAALRGLSVALIERGDFGSGTSQNSLKIIHGGLRYLQDGNLSRIRTMARERTTWMKIAPHLVHPLTCLMPTRKKISRSRLVMGAALKANDILSFDRNHTPDPEKHLGSGRIISQRELTHILPGYDIQPCTGAAVWHDAQIYNTERLLLEFVLSAVNAGAQVANYVEAIGFLKQGNRIVGVQAKDIESEQVFDIQSKIVINCAGAWIDDLLGTSALRSEHATSVAMNIIVDQVWSGAAAGLPSQPAAGKKSRILFFVPWRNKTMIGTWHMPWNDSPSAFKLTESIVQQFLNEINSAHPPLKLAIHDVRHITWGFLPVNKNDAYKPQVKLTRDGVVIDHHKKDGMAGLISVLGVKYTTARAVAEQAVDLAMDKLAAKAAKCQTHVSPVQGGHITDFRTYLHNAVTERLRNFQEETIEHLVYTYGSEYSRLAGNNLSQRIDALLPVTEAEVLHAVRNEMVVTLLDIIQRRTELGAFGLPTIRTLQRCADLISQELGWTAERQQREIDSVVQAYPFKHMERELA